MITCDGSFGVLLMYDVAEEIRLDELRGLLGAAPPGREPGFKLPAPVYVRFERPPVVEPCESLRLASGEQFDARLKYFDYGVVSLELEMRFRTGWRELIALSNRWIDNPELERKAVDAVHKCVAVVHKALRKPYRQWLDEIYYVIHLREIREADGNALGAARLIKEHGQEVTQIVRGEVTPLAESECREVLASSMSYYPSDLLVVGWMAALVYDSPEGAAPLMQLLEYANTQLLEYRRYDETLTGVLEHAYDALERRGGLFSRWRLAHEAQRLNKLRLDITELSEHASNAIKFLSDMFYARAYQLASAKVGVNDYRSLVEEKLRTADQLYQFMVNEFHQWRAFVLELMVVIILIIDLVFLFRGK